jgi:hypothetical protein
MFLRQITSSLHGKVGIGVISLWFTPLCPSPVTALH